MEFNFKEQDMSSINSINTFKQLGSVRLVAASNQSGTYFNGLTNNGVGATFTYATGALTIDSVVVALNDYILFSGQTAGYQNGLYQCTTAGATGVAAVLQRRGDFQCIEQIKGGQYCPVAAGTVYGGSMWTVVEPFPAAIGNPTVSGANNINFATITAAGSSLYLTVANNLSDVATPGTALANLGVHSARYTNAGGSATTTVTDARISATSIIVANWATSANAVNIQKVTPAAGSFTVLSSGDPGASTLDYIATTAAQ
jgi:hypothetical protein